MIKDKDQIDYIIEKIEEGLTVREIHALITRIYGYPNTAKTLSNIIPRIKRMHNDSCKVKKNTERVVQNDDSVFIIVPPPDGDITKIFNDLDL